MTRLLMNYVNGPMDIWHKLSFLAIYNVRFMGSDKNAKIVDDK